MRQGLAFVVSAPSGAGKTTLIAMLRKEFPRLGYSVSCTTRAKRAGETEGKDYFFLKPDEFEKMRSAGEFAEWAEVHGHFYGTPLAPVRTMLKDGIDVVFDIDVAGAAQIRGAIPDSVFVFIAPPSMAELAARLGKRDLNNEDSQKRRLGAAFGELREAFWYDQLIINEDLDLAYQQLKSCYIAATLAPGRNRWALERLLEEARAYHG